MDNKLPIPESNVSPEWYVKHLQEIADKSATLQSNQDGNEVSNQVEFEPLGMTPMQIAVYALNCPKEDKYFEEVANLIQRYADTKIWEELELPSLMHHTCELCGFECECSNQPCSCCKQNENVQVGSRYNYYCAERSHGGPVCLKQCDTCAKMLP